MTFTHPDSIYYPWLHKPGDSLDKINYTYFEKCSKLMLTIIAEIANKPIDVQVRIETPYEGRVYFRDIPVFKTPGLNILLSGLRGMTYIIGRPFVRVNITTDEDVAEIWYIIDGDVANIPSNETVWKLKKAFYPLIGKHTLGVRVFTNSGKEAYDEMDLFIIGLT